MCSFQPLKLGGLGGSGSAGRTCRTMAHSYIAVARAGLRAGTAPLLSVERLFLISLKSAVTGRACHLAEWRGVFLRG